MPVVVNVVGEATDDQLKSAQNIIKFILQTTKEPCRGKWVFEGLDQVRFESDQNKADEGDKEQMNHEEKEDDEEVDDSSSENYQESLEEQEDEEDNEELDESEVSLSSGSDKEQGDDEEVELSSSNAGKSTNASFEEEKIFDLGMIKVFIAAPVYFFNHKKGSTISAIKKYMTAEGCTKKQLQMVNDDLLKKLVKRGLLVQVSGHDVSADSRFKLSKETKKVMKAIIRIAEDMVNKEKERQYRKKKQADKRKAEKMSVDKGQVPVEKKKVVASMFF